MQTNETNVLSMRTKKPLLPFQVRAIIMGQYVESKASEHAPELFVDALEKRLISVGATAIIDVAKELFSKGK